MRARIVQRFTLLGRGCAGALWVRPRSASRSDWSGHTRLCGVPLGGELCARSGYLCYSGSCAMGLFLSGSAASWCLIARVQPSAASERTVRRRAARASPGCSRCFCGSVGSADWRWPVAAWLHLQPPERPALKLLPLPMGPHVQEGRPSMRCSKCCCGASAGKRRGVWPALMSLEPRSNTGHAERCYGRC